MVQKKSDNPINGTLFAAFLILIAAFLSSVVHQPQQEISGQIITEVTGFATATTFSSICQDANTILKVSGYKDASAGTLDSTTYSIRICGASSLGSGQTCKSDYSNAIIRIYDPNGDGKADTATVEKLNYAGTSGTPTQPSISYSGKIVSCYIQRSGSAAGSGTKCTPADCDTNMISLGIIDEYNENGKWYNGYRICVNKEVKGSLVSCKYKLDKTSCTLSACPTGTSLQTEISDIDVEPSAGEYYDVNGNPYYKDFVVNKYGICSDAKIKSATCTQTAKGRTCKTASPDKNLINFTNYITDIKWISISSRIFTYYDLFIGAPGTGPTGSVILDTTGAFSLPPISLPPISPQLPAYCSDTTWSGDESDLNCGGSCNKCADTLSCWSNSDCSSNNCYFDSTTSALRASSGIPVNYRSTNTQDIKYQGVCKAAVAPVQPPTGSSGYTNLCFGSGPYHYEDSAKGSCAVGDCVFTISADTNAKVADCSSTNAYSKTVCTGGACFGSDCSQISCQDQVSCNANTNCAWDPYETTSKCKSRTTGGICNQFGIKICNPADFIAGDYSCLYKDPQTSYYTKACVGSGQVGFWHIPEVY